MIESFSSSKSQKIIGVIITSIFGAFLTFGVVASIFSVDGLNLLLGSILLFGGPLAIGIYLLRSGSKKLKAAESDIMENMVLKLDEKNKGVLTQANLAKSSFLTLEKSKKVLDEFAQKGHAVVEVNDNGIIEYHFNGLK